MKTDVAKKVTVIDQPDKQIDNQQETGMLRRRQLQPLQQAAGDKENLVGGGKMPVTGKDETKINKKVPSPAVKMGLVEKKKQVKSSTHQKKKVITVEDLTSEAGPSEHYWETLAERRRVALEKSLEENQMLHERVALLERENEQCKTLLEQSKALIDTLNEVLADTQENTLDSGEEDSSIIYAESRPRN